VPCCAAVPWWKKKNDKKSTTTQLEWRRNSHRSSNEKQIRIALNGRSIQHVPWLNKERLAITTADRNRKRQGRSD
jgi:hypothetical protein